jgi:hypothetical protein
VKIEPKEEVKIESKTADFIGDPCDYMYGTPSD